MTETHRVYQPFYWRSLSIFHGDGVLKIGTDAILLGTWIGKVGNHPDSIIDAGCGTGILAIMAAAHFPKAHISAIDNLPEAVALTAQNAAHNNMTDRIFAAIRDITIDGPHTGIAQLILSNPPFYFNQLAATRTDNLQAKHAEHTAARWLQGLAQRLHMHGHIALVLPFDLTSKWIAAANGLGLYCFERLNVYSFERDIHPVRSLILLSRRLEKPKVDKLILYRSDQQYTDQYARWIK